MTRRRAAAPMRVVLSSARLPRLALTAATSRSARPMRHRRPLHRSRRRSARRPRRLHSRRGRAMPDPQGERPLPWRRSSTRNPAPRLDLGRASAYLGHVEAASTAPRPHLGYRLDLGRISRLAMRLASIRLKVDAKPPVRRVRRRRKHGCGDGAEVAEERRGLLRPVEGAVLHAGARPVARPPQQISQRLYLLRAASLPFARLLLSSWPGRPKGMPDTSASHCSGLYVA